jgi:glycerate dehydrogenase
MHVMISQRAGSDSEEPGRVALDEMLPQIDVLSLHCPLDVNTRHLIDRRVFELMPEHAVLINTARGGIVNEADLHYALKYGQIAAAAIDVLHEEPPGQDNLLLNQPLDNLIITPHVAWASRESRQRLLAEMVANISAYQAGQHRNSVNWR